eukprot:scaffold88131_cov30-Tisochrysis_lutea.AAC.5
MYSKSCRRKGLRFNVEASHTIAKWRLARVIATFSLRSSPRKPTEPRGLDRTSDSTIASDSRPWYPSTVAVSTASRFAALSATRMSSTWAAYGESTAIQATGTPAAARART